MTQLTRMPGQPRALGAALAIVLVCAGNDAWAQNTIVPDTGAGQDKFNVPIVNQSGQTVRFLLRPESGAWTEYALSAGEKSIYSCRGCGGNFEIQIRTGDVTVSYVIRTGTLYAIRPNPDKGIYDLYALQ